MGEKQSENNEVIDEADGEHFEECEREGRGERANGGNLNTSGSPDDH